MSKAEREPMEQIDYGINYKAQNSPQQSLNLKVEGGLLAIALALIALGAVLAACILMPEIIQSRANEAAAVAVGPVRTMAQSAQDRAWLAERNEKINAEQIKIFAAELSAMKGQPVRLDGH